MHPIAATGRPSDQASRPFRDAKPGTPGRALALVHPPIPVTVAPVERNGGHKALPRPSVGFLAQLIAARHNLPQARERRRAEPQQAIAAYAAAARAG
jgi:hypothetical protein